MKHRILCIDRACGSGGKMISQLAAEKLGINFYDSNLLEMAKAHGGITSTALDNSDETATNPFYYKLIYEGNENVESERPATEMLFQLQSAVIRQIAEKEDCIIVGRCADYILEHMEDVDVMSIFITSPLHNRIEREIQVEDMSARDAKRFILKTDKRRQTYYNFFSKRDWGKKNTYDFILNSENFGIEGSADILCALYRTIKS